MEQTDIAIIGAGPYGLALAMHLLRVQMEVRVFGTPMSFWRSMPMGMLLRLLPLMVRSAHTPEAHKSRLIEDVKQNNPKDAVAVSSPYLDYIAAGPDPTTRLAASGVPTWVVHAEKGDGGLTDAERATLEAAPDVTVVTIPGSVFLLPDEAPRRVAVVIAEALARLP